jgi:hypothetical protein
MSALAAVASCLVAIAVAQDQKPSENPRVLSGSSLGFRVDRLEGNRAVGTFMVKIDGQWVEAVAAPKAMAVR